MTKQHSRTHAKSAEAAGPADVPPVEPAEPPKAPEPSDADVRRFYVRKDILIELLSAYKSEQQPRMVSQSELTTILARAEEAVCWVLKPEVVPE